MAATLTWQIYVYSGADKWNNRANGDTSTKFGIYTHQSIFKKKLLATQIS